MSFKAILANNIVYKISNVLVLFVTTALLSRAMGVQGYGELSLLILNAAFFNMLSSLGFDSGITYSAASDVNNTGRIVGLSIVLIVFQAFLLLLIESICLAWLGRHWLLPESTQHAVLLGILFLVSLSLQEKFTALLNGNHLYTQANQTILWGNLFALLLFAFFLFVLKKEDSFLYLTLYILSSVLLALLLVFRSRRLLHFSVHFRVPKELLSLLFNYSLVVFVTNLLQFLAYRADLWFITYFRNETEVGWYAVAVRLLQLFWILPVLFASIVFPKVSAAKSGYDQKALLSLMRMLNAFNVAAGLLSVFCIKALLILVFGEQYLPSVAAFQILLPGVIFFSNATLLAAYFAGMNQLKLNLWGSVLCLLSVGCLDLILIPTQGYIGAAIASSIGYSLTAIYFIVLYCRETKTALADLLLPQKADMAQLRFVGKNLFLKKQ